MYIDTKYIYVNTGNSYMEYPPKLYVDFFILRANLKRNWRSNNTFQAEIGLFGKSLMLNINWGFVERKRTEEEEDTYQRAKKFIEDVFLKEK